MKPHNKKQQPDMKIKMAPQRTTRSTKSTTLAARPPSESPKKRATLPRTKTTKSAITRPKTRSSKDATPPTDADTASLTDGEAADEQENDDDEKDVHAPSSDPQTRELSSDASKIWTGPTMDLDGDDSMNIEDDQMSEAGSKTSDFLEDLNISDDDNYDDIDQISNASESSEAFEREVEKEIIEAGEDAIDWNDENTYGFNGSFEPSQYSMSLDFESLLPPFDEDDIFGLGSRMAAARVSDRSPPKNVPHGAGSAQGKGQRSGLSDGSGFSQHGESSGSDRGSRRSSVTQDVSHTPSQSLDAIEDDVTDDDEPYSNAIASPSVTLSRTSSRLAKNVETTRFITDEKPRKKIATPMRRKIPIDCSKVVAFTSGNINGRRFRVKRRHNHYFKWVQISASPYSTAPNSPTMIDLQSALGQGNTRTGAALTDVINGRLFQQLHCGHESNSVIDSSILVSEFARMHNLRPLASGGSIFGWRQDFMLMQGIDPHEETLALVDFNGGADDDDEEDMVAEEGEVMGRAEVNDEDVMHMPESIPQIFGPQHDLGMSDLETRFLQTPPTPTSPNREFLLPVGNSSSPKKRRASTLSARRSVSPVSKRVRAESSEQVAL